MSYSNAAKSQWLGVQDGVLGARGAVSAQVAEAMAVKARQRTVEAVGEPAIGVSVTGYAGPGGGTEQDPVGTVFFGIADEHGSGVRRRQLGHGRNRVRALAVQIALELLRRRILRLS